MALITSLLITINRGLSGAVVVISTALSLAGTLSGLHAKRPIKLRPLRNYTACVTASLSLRGGTLDFDIIESRCIASIATTPVSFLLIGEGDRCCRLAMHVAWVTRGQ